MVDTPNEDDTRELAPITCYLSEIEAISNDAINRVRRTQECEDRYFPGVIDRDYSPNLRLAPEKIDTQGKLWFFIHCSLLIDQWRNTVLERTTKARELPHIMTEANKTFSHLDTHISKKDIRKAANDCLYVVYERLAFFGLSMIVPLAPWPELSRSEAIVELRRAGEALVQLERNRISAQRESEPLRQGKSVDANQRATSKSRKPDRPPDLAMVTLGAVCNRLGYKSRGYQKGVTGCHESGIIWAETVKRSSSTLWNVWILQPEKLPPVND